MTVKYSSSHRVHDVFRLVETKEVLFLPLFSDEICNSDVVHYKKWTGDAGEDIYGSGAMDRVLVGNSVFFFWSYIAGQLDVVVKMLPNASLLYVQQPVTDCLSFEGH